MMNFTVLMVGGCFVMIFWGVWSFMSYHKHLLNSLLSSECMVLGVFWLSSMQMGGLGSEIYFSVFFLTLAACEGALRVSLLVLVARGEGNDLFTSFNLLEC